MLGKGNRVNLGYDQWIYCNPDNDTRYSTEVGFWICLIEYHASSNGFFIVTDKSHCKGLSQLVWNNIKVNWKESIRRPETGKNITLISICITFTRFSRFTHCILFYVLFWKIKDRIPPCWENKTDYRDVNILL